MVVSFAGPTVGETLGALATTELDPLRSGGSFPPAPIVSVGLAPSLGVGPARPCLKEMMMKTPKGLCQSCKGFGLVHAREPGPPEFEANPLFECDDCDASGLEKGRKP